MTDEAAREAYKLAMRNASVYKRRFVQGEGPFKEWLETGDHPFLDSYLALMRKNAELKACLDYAELITAAQDAEIERLRGLLATAANEEEQRDGVHGSRTMNEERGE